MLDDMFSPKYSLLDVPGLQPMALCGAVCALSIAIVLY